MRKTTPKKNKKWSCGMDMAHEIESIKKIRSRRKSWSNVGKGAFIGFLIIISICFILGWVIV